MLDGRTAWAIALLLAPTGVAAGSMTGVGAPAGHTAYVELTIDADEERSSLAAVDVQVTCQPQGHVARAMAWLGEDCKVPPGSVVYVALAQAPDPRQEPLLPTGTVYVLEGEQSDWRVREYAYASPSGEGSHAYVLDPQQGVQIGEGPTYPLRGVVDLANLGLEPGDRAKLEATLGAGPTTAIEDPDVQRVDASQVASLAS